METPIRTPFATKRKRFAPLPGLLALALLAGVGCEPSTPKNNPLGFMVGQQQWDPHYTDVRAGVLRSGFGYNNPGGPVYENEALLSEAQALGSQVFTTVYITRKPDDEGDFRNWVRDLVERYDGDGVADAPGSPVVYYYQLGNELTLAKHWKDSWADYADTLRWFHEEVEAQNPAARVVLGGARKGNGAMTIYLEEILPAIAAEMGQEKPQPFEMVDQHNIDSGKSLDYSVVEENIAAYRARLAELGMSAEFCLTETSTWSGTRVFGPPSAQTTVVRTEPQQAIEVVKRLLTPLLLGCRFAMWNRTLEWDSFGGNPDSPFTRTGLIHNPANGHDDDGDGVADDWEKVGYYAYRELASRLTSVKTSQIVDVTPPGLDGRAALVFGTKGPFWIVWRDTPESEPAEPVPVSLPIYPGVTHVRIREAVPDAVWGHEIDDPDDPDWFKVLDPAAPVVGGRVTLLLTERPVYVEPIVP